VKVFPATPSPTKPKGERGEKESPQMAKRGGEWAHTTVEKQLWSAWENVEDGNQERREKGEKTRGYP